MRNILKNREEAAHFWAHQTQESGRVKNMFFLGSKIYSYGTHYTIATRIDTRTYLVNASKYLLDCGKSSVSTQKHIAIVREAIPHFAEVFTVTNPNAATEKEHEENFNTYLENFESTFESIKRSRKHGLALWWHAHDILAEANKYRVRFGLQCNLISIEVLYDQSLLEKIGRQTDAKKSWPHQ